jgi:hypothetical protein
MFKISSIAVYRAVVAAAFGLLASIALVAAAARLAGYRRGRLRALRRALPFNKII